MEAALGELGEGEGGSELRLSLTLSAAQPDNPLSPRQAWLGSYGGGAEGRMN